MASITDENGHNQGFAWTPTQKIRIERRASAILACVQPANRKQVLEIGCGTGELAHFLSSDGTASITGVDVSAKFVDGANEKFASPTVKFVRADLAEPQEIKRLGALAGTGGFSAVVGNGILHHLYHQLPEALANFAALLQPGGDFVFFEPNLFNPYVYAIFSAGPLRKLAKLEPDEMAFTPAFIADHLRNAGYVDIDVSFKDFLIPNLPYALVPAVTTVGDWAEKNPATRWLAQSLLIRARKSSSARAS